MGSALSAGRVISVNISTGREVAWRGRTVRTGIFKEPVAGSVVVRRLGLDGDVQADPRFHGGPDKAVYAYPSEHYAFWQGEFPERELGWGTFGENLTTEGLREEEVRIGDVLRIGTSDLEVTQPRFPCFKLGIKFGRPDIIPRFLRSGRSGFYFAVRTEGVVAAGDRIEFVHRSREQLTIAGAFRRRTEE